MKPFKPLLVAAIVLGAPSLRAEPVNDVAGIKVTPDIPYADTSNAAQRLDLYLPAKRVGDKSLPVIVFIHGGAWQAGNKASGRASVQRFVSRGPYAGASVEYRLSQHPRGRIVRR